MRWKALLMAGLLSVSSAYSGTPPSGGEFTLRRTTIDSGGGASSGGVFSMMCTIGQPDTQVMQAAEFALRGGFWTPSGPSDFLFFDGFES